MNLHQFYIGECFDAYRYFGAHQSDGGYVFRTYAPRALRVALIGEFSHWNEIEMKRIDDGGVYECYVENAYEWQMYQYRITGADGKVLNRSDPYGFATELRPGFASKICHLESYHYHDMAWQLRQNAHYNEPLNIFEIHLGSFKRHPDGHWYTYVETAEALIPYLHHFGYTHVELLPVAEHPCDESWGYQTSGFFSATSRYGSPHDLMAFVDMMHQNNIGVIFDVVPVHFAVNDFALCLFDGTPLYEYDNHDSGYSEWGSYNFNYYRQEVASFMQSAMAFYLDVYHADGLRMDAIANAIYWQGDQKRGVNDGAVRFIQKMNDGLHHRFRHAILIAEDSTNYLKVTAPVAYDGMGFDYKWDMGWMNDTLKFFALDPSLRQNHMQLLTFSMHYFYNELYLLPLSHDEVVHGKKTMIDKMPGTYDEKFANARLLYLYMFTHPGKKLNFMGNEIAMFREWDEKREQDWNLLTFPKHEMFANYFKDLSLTYRAHPSLFQRDYDAASYQQIYLQDGLYIYQRRSKDEVTIVAFNFTNHPQTITYQGKNTLEELMNSQWDFYGGNLASTTRLFSFKSALQLVPLSGRLFVVKGEEENEHSSLFVASC